MYVLIFTLGSKDLSLFLFLSLTCLLAPCRCLCRLLICLSESMWLLLCVFFLSFWVKSYQWLKHWYSNGYPARLLGLVVLVGMGCPYWHTAMLSLRLQRFLWIHCPGHAGVSGKERADRLASAADITSGLQLGRAEVLQGLRNFLNMDRPEHHSIDCLHERGVEKWSGRNCTVSRATLGKLLRDGAERYGPFRALWCHLELKLDWFLYTVTGYGRKFISSFCHGVAACIHIVWADQSLRNTSILMGHYASNQSTSSETGWQLCKYVHSFFFLLYVCMQISRQLFFCWQLYEEKWFLNHSSEDSIMKDLFSQELRFLCFHEIQWQCCVLKG